MLLGSELQDVSVGLKHGWLCDVWFFFYKSCVDSCLDYSISSCFQKFFCRIFSSGCTGKGSGLQEGGSTRCLLDPCLVSGLCWFQVSSSSTELGTCGLNHFIESLLSWLGVFGVKRWLLTVGRTQLRSQLSLYQLAGLRLRSSKVSRATPPFLYRSWW